MAQNRDTSLLIKTLFVFSSVFKLGSSVDMRYFYFKDEVAGSSPVQCAKSALVAQLVERENILCRLFSTLIFVTLPVALITATSFGETMLLSFNPWLKF